MTWHQTCDKTLSETVMASFINVYTSLSLDESNHWGHVRHICVSKLSITGSDNGLSPGRRQAIIWTNNGILLIESLRTNFHKILIKIYKFSFKKIHFKMLSGKWWLSCPTSMSLQPSYPQWTVWYKTIFGSQNIGYQIWYPFMHGLPNWPPTLVLSFTTSLIHGSQLVHLSNGYQWKKYLGNNQMSYRDLGRWMMPQSYHTPGPRKGCSRAVQGLFWTKIVGPLMGPIQRSTNLFSPYGAHRVLMHVS